jgi:hypothetical protein
MKLPENDLQFWLWLDKKIQEWRQQNQLSPADPDYVSLVEQQRAEMRFAIEFLRDHVKEHSKQERQRLAALLSFESECG